jgi:hypothetical protein
MLNSLNLTTHHRSRAVWPIAHAENRDLSGHGINRAVPLTLLEHPPFVRLTRARCSSSLRQADAIIELCQLAPKLDFRLNYTKHSTSQFLIDNFRASVPLATPIRLVHRDAGMTAKVGPAYEFSNRESKLLETPVSYRKQTTAPRSNREEFSFFQLPFLPLQMDFCSSSLSRHFRLTPLATGTISSAKSGYPACPDAISRDQAAHQAKFEREVS